MSESAGEVRYELTVTAEEARQGVSKLLPRNNKRLQVNIPPGVSAGSVVKLTGALQVTDGRPGDILISIKVKEAEAPVSKEAEAPAGVVVVTDADFDREVLQSPLPVVVDFWAPWCGPCKMMAPVLESAAVHFQGKLKVCKINVDENPASARQYQAMSIPMLLFFKAGQLVDKSVGALPDNQLAAKIESFLS